MIASAAMTMRATNAPVEPTLWWYFIRAALVRAWVQISTRDTRPRRAAG